MPAVDRAGSRVAFGVGRLLSGREFGAFAWVKTHGQHAVLLPKFQVHFAHAFHQAVQNLRAQHWATVVCEYQDDRTGVEIISEANGRTVFISEREIKRKLDVE